MRAFGRSTLGVAGAAQAAVNAAELKRERGAGVRCANFTALKGKNGWGSCQPVRFQPQQHHKQSQSWRKTLSLQASGALGETLEPGEQRVCGGTPGFPGPPLSWSRRCWGGPSCLCPASRGRASGGRPWAGDRGSGSRRTQSTLGPGPRG